MVSAGRRRDRVLQGNHTRAEPASDPARRRGPRHGPLASRDCLVQRACGVEEPRSDQKTWTAVHQVLAGSVPSDPEPPLLIGLTRLVGKSVNNKTGNRVRVSSRPGPRFRADSLQEWCDEVGAAVRFKEVGGTILFGDSVDRTCPYCGSEEFPFGIGRPCWVLLPRRAVMFALTACLTPSAKTSSAGPLDVGFAGPKASKAICK